MELETDGGTYKLEAQAWRRRMGKDKDTRGLPAQTEGKNEAHLLVAGFSREGRAAGARACLNTKPAWDCEWAEPSSSVGAGSQDIILLGEANSRAGGGVSHGRRKQRGHPRRSLNPRTENPSEKESQCPISKDILSRFPQGRSF